MDNTAQMIAYYAPDIVGMQEVVKRINSMTWRSVFLNILPLGVGRADGKEKEIIAPFL